MKQFKRILAMFLCAVMVFGILPAFPFAASAETTPSSSTTVWEWDFDEAPAEDATGVPGWTPNKTVDWSTLSWVERAEGDGCLEWFSTYGTSGTVSVYSDAFDVSQFANQTVMLEYDVLGSYTNSPIMVYLQFFGTADGTGSTVGNAMAINSDQYVKTTWSRCGSGSANTPKVVKVPEGALSAKVMLYKSFRSDGTVWMDNFVVKTCCETHTYNNGVASDLLYAEATCTSGAQYYQRCDSCDYVNHSAGGAKVTVGDPVHNLRYTPAVTAIPDTSMGNVAYWTCADCNAVFDAEGNALTETTVLPEITYGNMLRFLNNSFEDGLTGFTGWYQVGSGSFGYASSSTETASDGTTSLKISGLAGQLGVTTTKPVPVTPGDTITISVDFISNLIPETNGYYGNETAGTHFPAQVYVDFLDENGQNVSRAQATKPGTGEWQTLTISTKVPSGAVSVLPVIMKYPTNSPEMVIYYDNLQLTQSASQAGQTLAGAISIADFENGEADVNAWAKSTALTELKTDEEHGGYMAVTIEKETTARPHYLVSPYFIVGDCSREINFSFDIRASQATDFQVYMREFDASGTQLLQTGIMAGNNDTTLEMRNNVGEWVHVSSETNETLATKIPTLQPGTRYVKFLMPYTGNHVDKENSYFDIDNVTGTTIGGCTLVEEAADAYLATGASCTEAATYFKHCVTCGEIDYTATFASGEALGHTAGAAATCTEDQICTTCGEVLAEATGHTNVKTVLGNNGLCYCSANSDGSGEKGLTDGELCLDCFTVLTPQELTEIPAHTIEILPGQDATCNGTGLTEGQKCSVCNQTLGAQEEIEATGVHAFDQMVSDPKYLVSDATTTEGAVFYMSCACGLAGTETFTLELTPNPMADLNWDFEAGADEETGLPTAWEDWAKAVGNVAVIEDGDNSYVKLTTENLPATTVYKQVAIRSGLIDISDWHIMTASVDFKAPAPVVDEGGNVTKNSIGQIYFCFYDEHGVEITTARKATSKNGTDEWDELNLTVRIPTGAKYASVGLYAPYADNYVCYDDVVVRDGSVIDFNYPNAIELTKEEALAGWKVAGDILDTTGIVYDAEKGYVLKIQNGANKSPNYLRSPLVSVHGMDSVTITFDYKGSIDAQAYWYAYDKDQEDLKVPGCVTKLKASDTWETYSFTMDLTNLPDGATAEYVDIILPYVGATEGTFYLDNMQFSNLSERKCTYTTHETVAPTCGVEGYDLHTCACGVSYKDNFVEATGEHTPAEEAVIENEIPATCGQDGSYDVVVYCTACEGEVSRTTETVPATGEHIYGEGVVTTEPTYEAAGEMTYTCEICGATKTEEIPQLENKPVLTDRYDIGSNVQIGLLEPWFLQVSSVVYPKDNHGAPIDYNTVDYGVYMIRESKLGKSEGVTYEDIVNAEDAVHLTKESGKITLQDVTGNGHLYMVARYDEGLYTYEMDDTVYVVFYVEEADGISYDKVRARNLHDLLEARKTDERYNELERAVYMKMLAMYDNVSIYREGKEDVLKRYEIPTLAESGKQFTAHANDAYKIGTDVALILVEPWGMRFGGVFYTASNMQRVDYAAAEDYGAIVYYDVEGNYAEGMSVEQLYSEGAAKVYSKLDGTVYDRGDGYIAAEYEGDIYTYQLNTNAYVMYYIKDADGYHYSKVFTRNAYDLAVTRAADAAKFPDAEERAVYQSMADMYDSITAYREWWFANH